MTTTTAAQTRATTKLTGIAREGVKLLPDDNFLWTYTEEPHRTRRQEIIKAHKDVLGLCGPEPLTKYVVLAVVSLQIACAFALKNTPPKSWHFWLTAYLVGATANQNLFLAIHEISHNLAFKSPVYNRIFAILANLPIGLPYSAGFRQYHLTHHKSLGVDGVDTDLPTALEAIFFDSVFGKAFFCTFQLLFYAVRPMFIYRIPFGIVHYCNIVAQLVFDIIIVKCLGWNAMIYLLLSSFLAGSIHPCAGHFISEHYVFARSSFKEAKMPQDIPIPETFSYYGPLNFLTYNQAPVAVHGTEEQNEDQSYDADQVIMSLDVRGDTKTKPLPYEVQLRPGPEFNFEDRKGRFLQVSSQLDLDSKTSIGSVRALISYLQRKRASECLQEDQKARFAYRTLRIKMFNFRNTMFANVDTLSTLQIIQPESHPNIFNQGPGTSGSKEVLSVFGLFQHHARTPQGKAQLRTIFLRPSLDVNVINERLDTNDADWEQSFSTADQVYFKNAQMRQMDHDLGDLWGNICDIEIKLTYDLAKSVLENEEVLIEAPDTCGELDSLLALVHGAIEHKLIQPRLVEEDIIDIKAGWHLQEMTVQSDESQMPNMIVLTGSNYSGKSVYQKKVALVAYMAQMVSFVAAKACTIGITDKILTSIATAETIWKTRSAFTIDLQQISLALNLCSNRSLVLIDEFGRGMDSCDGAGLAAGVFYYLLDRSSETPKVLVASHHHEVFETGIFDDHPKLRHSHMAITLTK
ncbi:hypothetical protein DV736_g4193, partial [Chaetothyriales sp. CBS 134916]